MLGDLPGSMNEEKEHLELSSTACHWQGEGSLLRVTSTAPWAVLRLLRPHSPKPIQIHTAPGLRLCSAGIISGNDGPLCQRQPKLPHVFSLALPNTQGMSRGYLWADSQKDCVPLTFAKVVHFIQSWREGAEQSKSPREEFFRQGS